MLEIRPNIVLIMTDQQRWDTIPAAGVFPVQAPGLDRLLADGVWFPRTYCQGPLCVPSRASFLSGRYPHQTRCEDNETSLWPEAPSFVGALRDAGYRTANVGKLHYTWFHDLELLVSQPLLRRLGFDDPLETTGKMSQGNVRASAYTEHLRARGLLERFRADLLARAKAGPLASYQMRPSTLSAADHVDGWVMGKAAEWLATIDSEPFFLWVGPPGPHDPFDPPAPYSDMYDPLDMPVGPLRYQYPVRSDAISAAIPDATPREIQQMRSQYLGNVSFLADLTASLLDVLRRRGLLERTWLFYCSDHGEMLGDHRLIWKAQFFEPASRVPLIVRPPDGAAFRRGETDDALVELLDVPATMLEIAGGRLDGAHGRSLLPRLRAAGLPHRDMVTCSLPGQLMVRDDGVKAIIERDTGRLVRAFDLDDDPLEEHDQVAAGHSRVSAHAERLARLARQWLLSLPSDMPEPWHHDIPYQRWGRNPLRETVDSLLS